MFWPPPASVTVFSSNASQLNIVEESSSTAAGGVARPGRLPPQCQRLCRLPPQSASLSLSLTCLSVPFSQHQITALCKARTNCGDAPC